MVSMLTDPFSPWLLEQGITEQALLLILEHTRFRVRILTKSAAVGSSKWIEFFRRHPDRFVVGLSTGTINDEWAKRVEIGTSSPSQRLAALRRLQDGGVPTYGMLCPVFPDVMMHGGVNALLELIDPDRVEHIWAEPYNDRFNWRAVRDSYAEGSYGAEWLTDVYEQRKTEHWSRYAVGLYATLRDHAERQGWMHKLRYLLYEDLVAPEDASRLGRLEGVLLQSKPASDGESRNPHVARLQRSV